MGYGVQVGTTIVGDPAKNPTLLPKSKFAIFTSRPISNDPRSSNLLRPLRRLVDETAGLARVPQVPWVWATPITIGKTPQHAVETIDPATGTKIAATQAMLTTLLSLKNNSAAVFPFGSEIDLHEASGDGTVFGRAVDTLDRQITTAILYQTLATMEGAHQSRAASTTHKSTLDTIIRQAKRGLCGMLRTQVLRQLVAVNFGDDAARDLTPIPSLGSVEDPDITGRMTAVANLKRAGYPTRASYPASTPSSACRRARRSRASTTRPATSRGRPAPSRPRPRMTRKDRRMSSSPYEWGLSRPWCITHEALDLMLMLAARDEVDTEALETGHARPEGAGAQRWQAARRQRGYDRG